MAKGKDEGPYHNNPHKDAPASGNPGRVTQGTDISQGKQQSEEKGESNKGMTGPIR
jgi:hypothetical protein